MILSMQHYNYMIKEHLWKPIKCVTDSQCIEIVASLALNLSGGYCLSSHDYKVLSQLLLSIDALILFLSLHIV